MSHIIVKVTKVKVLEPYVLLVEFDDGASPRVDLGNVLRGELYGPLRDPKLFAQAAVDPEIHTVVWPNGADFDPATLYDWPKVAPDFEAMAQKWPQGTDASATDAS
jgi:hypothetical protein